MGLTADSVGKNAVFSVSAIRKQEQSDKIIALAGNPNVGKSTIFNALTGLKQHTGNWPGKTVTLAQGRCEYKGYGYELVDLPGTYSLLSRSREERVAADFIASGVPDCVLVICDATCLERNLNLVLQIMELTDRVVVCVNLMDEARKKEIHLDLRRLESELGVPVVGTAAGRQEGLQQLQERIRNVTDGFEAPHPRRCGYFPTEGKDGKDVVEILHGQTERQSDQIAKRFVRRAEEIADTAVCNCGSDYCLRERRWDKILTGRWTGIPILLVLLLGIFWLTIQGANYPSELLQSGFDALGRLLWRGATAISAPAWLAKPLLDGVYTTTAKVVAVMLPPIAIFFPLFTLLEDVGYLPRIAFMMDQSFCRCGACGKQALTMAMGFGCNAAGVVGCRIIDSPRERLIGILTNALVPCNGRFPTLIVFSSLLFSGTLGSFGAAAILTGCVLLGVGMTLLSSLLLGKTVLRGMPSSFTLELPPFRRPDIGRVIVRSVLDRTLFVLGRAVAVAAPAGLLIWCAANVQLGGQTILASLAGALQPVGLWLGMNGILLLAFILGFPANELVLPVALLALTAGAVLPGGDTQLLRETFQQGGWTWQTAICGMVFTLFHWPCSTTVLTIKRETGSWKWAACAMLLPTVLGVILCRLLYVLL